MKELTTKIGIIICDRYKGCAGGKCFRAAENREGAFERYRDQELEIVAIRVAAAVREETSNMLLAK